MRYIIMVLLFTAAIGAAIAAKYPSPAPLPTSTVKVLVDGGHGSGVHIGNGYVLTAAHVTRGRTATLRLSDGTEIAAETLWENKSYDVALLRTEARLQVAPLSCRSLTSGERIVAHGNPMSLEFVSAHGYVVGAAQQLGPWQSAMPVDMTIVMGMSGGGVLDRDGQVVGLAIGVVPAAIGISVSLTGFGIIVPSNVACMLLGRTA